MRKPAQDLLRNAFGYESFRPLQEEVIESVLHKRDALVVMPTGGGKSICFQIPALLFPGLTIVVSPLISLMKDQVEQLAELGIPAVYLNSSLSPVEYRRNVERIERGEVKLLYVAPEALQTSRLLALLSSLSVDCLTIDEAHCISAWGHDFRPEYRQLIEVRARFPEAVCIALTATATPRVRADIKRSLRFKKSQEFIDSFNRENLFLEIIPKNRPLEQTVRLIEKFPGQSGIIYCFSRQQVDKLSESLKRRGFSVRPYHAGLPDEERQRNQELFIHSEVQIIVATIAFGMGINKPDVRFVVHYDLPKDIESYYQETGRAGRDGLPAHCLLLYSYADVQKIRYFFKQKRPSDRKVAEAHLDSLLQLAETTVCRRVPLMDYFGEKYTRENCGMCDNCRAVAQHRVDIAIPAQKFISCVVRTGELFGPAHIVDVLLGSENQKVLKFNHQRLSTHGIGQEYSRQQWLHLARQLIEKGLLRQEEQYGSLKLTEKAYEMLRSKETLWGVILAEPVEAPPEKGPAQKVGIEHEFAGDLFERLKHTRRDLAEAAGVPAFVVFSDKTLKQMASHFPTTPESLLRIHGVGAVKLEKYGEAFMKVIRDYCNSKNGQEN